MSVCVLYRNPNHWTDWDEIWHGGGPQGWKVLGGGLTWYPHPPGTGCINGVRGASGASAILAKTLLNKSCRAPPKCEGRSPFWTPHLDLEGPRPHVLLEPSLTLKGSS